MTLEYFPVFFRTCFTIPGLSRPGKLLWNSRTFHDFKYLYYLCSSDYVSLISFTWHKKIIWSDFFSCGHLELAAILNWLPSWTGCHLQLAAIFNWLPSRITPHLKMVHIQNYLCYLRRVNNKELMYCIIWHVRKAKFSKYLKNPRWQPAAILNFHMYKYLCFETLLNNIWHHFLWLGLFDVYFMAKNNLKWFFVGGHFELAAIFN